MGIVTTVKRVLKIRKQAKNDYVNMFLDLQKQKGVTDNTIISHRHALGSMFQDGFNTNDLNAKLQSSLPKSISDSYYNKKLNAYRMFFDFLVGQNVITFNPASEWKYKKHSIKITDVDDHEVKRFLSNIDKRTFSGYRDYAFAMLILDTGMRPSEALGLLPSDIDPRYMEVNLRPEVTKTGIFRRVPLSKIVLDIINKFISYKPTEWQNGILFCSSTGKELRTASIQDRFRILSKENSIDISPYQLRHIFATTYIRNGGDTFSLQQILGHTSTQMTRVYVNLNIKDLHEKHERVSTINNFVQKRMRKL